MTVKRRRYDTRYDTRAGMQQDTQQDMQEEVTSERTTYEIEEGRREKLAGPGVAQRSSSLAAVVVVGMR